MAGFNAGKCNIFAGIVLLASGLSSSASDVTQEARVDGLGQTKLLTHGIVGNGYSPEPM